MHRLFLRKTEMGSSSFLNNRFGMNRLKKYIFINHRKIGEENQFFARRSTVRVCGFIAILCRTMGTRSRLSFETWTER